MRPARPPPMPSENLRPSPQPAPARRLRKSNQTIHCRLARRRVPHQSPARFRRHQPVPRRFKPSDRQTARHHFADHPARTKLPAPLQNHTPRHLRPSVANRRNARRVRQPVFQFGRHPTRRRQEQRVRQTSRTMAHALFRFRHFKRHNAPSRVGRTAKIFAHKSSD